MNHSFRFKWIMSTKLLKMKESLNGHQILHHRNLYLTSMIRILNLKNQGWNISSFLTVIRIVLFLLGWFSRSISPLITSVTFYRWRFFYFLKPLLFIAKKTRNVLRVLYTLLICFRTKISIYSDSWLRKICIKTPIENKKIFPRIKTNKKLFNHGK